MKKNETQEKIKLLIKQRTDAYLQIKMLNLAIEEIKQKIELPALKIKYEGKYFKWKMGQRICYTYVIPGSVAPDGTCLVMAISEITYSPLCLAFKIKQGGSNHVSNLGASIKKAEFNAAAKRCLKFTEKLITK